MQLYLICHGMMAFWYRDPSSPGAKDDGYRILIPQSPACHHCTHNEHELRIAAAVGGLPTQLAYAAKPEGTKFYSLVFNRMGDGKARGKKDRTTQLVTYRQQGGPTAVPQFGTDADPEGVAFVIDIPYPEKEENVRTSSYAKPPYQEGATVMAFDIHPKTLVGTRVFVFDFDGSGEIALQNQNDPSDRRQLVPAGSTGLMKIHLYNEPLSEMNSAHHLSAYNQMFLLGKHPLDLAVRADSEPTHHPAALLPGMTLDDAKTLIELNAFAHEHGFTIDPADCNQGGGC